jgi:hypothetical protein
VSAENVAELPSLDMVAKNWEKMAAQLNSYGCSFRLELSGGGWSCTIFDPALYGGSNSARMATKEEAIRDVVATWENLWKQQERRLLWPTGPQ